MYRNLLYSPPLKSLVAQGLGYQQTRNAVVLKRRWPPGLEKKGSLPRKMKSKHFIYDFVEDTNLKSSEVKIILTQYVSGLGEMGDIVQMDSTKAYLEYFLLGKAKYCSPENLEKYKPDPNKLSDSIPKKTFSSRHVERTMACLSRFTLYISMNISQPWVLQPWHVKASFRKGGFEVPEHAIQLPPREICGPDPALDDKEFIVKVTINKTETVSVRARIFHWGNGAERTPTSGPYHGQLKEPLFLEQAEELSQIPLIHHIKEKSDADSDTLNK